MSPLDEAKKLVHGDRGEAYGHPADDYQATVDIWRAMIRRRYGVDIPLTPDFGCLMMVAVKLSRESGKPKADNLVDAAGYVECAAMCLERKDDVRKPTESPGKQAEDTCHSDYTGWTEGITKSGYVLNYYTPGYWIAFDGSRVWHTDP